MRIKITSFFIGLNFLSLAMAAGNIFEAKLVKGTYLIDGKAEELFWADQQWYAIDKVWLPFGTTVNAADFNGRFKLAWTPERLLMLVEVTDDILLDQYNDPLERYWDDDCVEVFLDEDHSGGNHETGVGIAFNAFAYHVSTKGDVADMGETAKGLFNEHIKSALISKGSLHTWELEIKIYDKTYVNTVVSKSVVLQHLKKMGFSLAYCDNDKSSSRENFIGAVSVSEANQNNSYKDASVFGELTLIDPNFNTNTGSKNAPANDKISIYPNPTGEILNICMAGEILPDCQFVLSNASGMELKRIALKNNNSTIGLEKIIPGIYFVEIRTYGFIHKEKLVVL